MLLYLYLYLVNIISMETMYFGPCSVSFHKEFFLFDVWSFMSSLYDCEGWDSDVSTHDISQGRIVFKKTHSISQTKQLELRRWWITTFLWPTPPAQCINRWTINDNTCWNKMSCAVYIGFNKLVQPPTYCLKQMWIRLPNCSRYQYHYIFQSDGVLNHFIIPNTLLEKSSS